jgi:transcription termination factor Rho
MSPTPKKDSTEVAETVAEAPAPRKRGRPRKNPETESAKESAKATAASNGEVAADAAEAAEDAAPAKPKRGRKPRAAAEAESGEASADAGAEAATATPEAEEQSAAEERAEKAPKRGAKAASKASADDDGGDASEADDADSKDDGGRRGRNRGRNRSNRTPRKAPLNFRDLQSKILPELHLLAKEVGLEDYRQMEKDDLAVAILERSSEAEGLRLVRGYLEISSDGYGFLQESLLQNNTRSVIVSAGLIKQFRLRTGDHIMGKARRPRDNERYGTLIRVEAVNNVDPFQASKRPRFEDLTPTFPEQRIQLETTSNELSTRVIDLLAPIGRGQRGLIVAPPKAGKTTLLKKIANAVVTTEPDIKVIVLLVDERPEEVTDFRESVQGVEVVASTFDEPPANHIRVAEFVHERARRIVEDNGHVMILLDSITRLARANNLVTPPTGRTLSGGLDSNALHWPKRFLGAARNIRGGGSLSILATALVETGSRMDDVIFEEFKGTGNMELHLSRHLEERRIFPAIDILKSGTRREDLLLGEDVLAKMWLLRKVISDMDPAEAMEMLLGRLGRTKSNAEFLSTLTQG